MTTNDDEVRRPFAIRLLVYIMLVASAGAAFLLNDWLWRTTREQLWPVWMPLVPAAIFTLFVVVYTIDRWLLVRRRHFPPLRAFFQIALAVVFLALLWPKQATRLRQERTDRPERASSIVVLLHHKDPMVRAAACELVGYRYQLELREDLEKLAAGDASSLVRASCSTAIERLRALP